ncbi:helix-turn-helix domain-containing protein [Romboutsia weinsteinii]|uniref:helix-turn-helix domain-containing protein n=1 Tax=Romboutsia weinsteinii TaxID=2020949 RepID=UPI001FB13679|nr:helix-turn-helix transcriptional regulator [Romboutsia weinsteinii]
MKKVRIREGLSQEQLIAQLNLLGLDLDRTSLSRIENYNREVYDYELVYLSKALNINITDLYDEFNL